MNLAVIQLSSQEKPEENRAAIETLLREAASRGAEIVALPETVYYRGRISLAPAETVPGATTDFIARIARELGIWIHGGTVAEKAADGRFHNTAFIVSPSGELILVYRKIHLFDIDLEDNVNAVQESRHTAPGKEVACTKIGPFTASTLICYDLRFPEIWSTLRLLGADLFFLPANFTRKTGEAHWEVLLRARAIENQAYVAAPAQWGIHPAHNFPTYGRAMIVSPWGEILAEAPTEGDAIAMASIDSALAFDIRRKMPVIRHRQSELYRV